MYESATFPDERLELIFICCHPALMLEAQVALTLRTLGGRSTEEIALAFLVPTETMNSEATAHCEGTGQRGEPEVGRFKHVFDFGAPQ